MEYKLSLITPTIYSESGSKNCLDQLSEDFASYLKHRADNEFHTPCKYNKIAGLAYIHSFTEFEERFLIHSEYAVIIVSPNSQNAIRRFLPRLLVFLTSRSIWQNRFIFVILGNAEVSDSLVIHAPIKFSLEDWKTHDDQSWIDLFNLIKVKWIPYTGLSSVTQTVDVSTQGSIAFVGSSYYVCDNTKTQRSNKTPEETATNTEDILGYGDNNVVSESDILIDNQQLWNASFNQGDVVECGQNKNLNSEKPKIPIQDNLLNQHVSKNELKELKLNENVTNVTIVEEKDSKNIGEGKYDHFVSPVVTEESVSIIDSIEEQCDRNIIEVYNNSGTKSVIDDIKLQGINADVHKANVLENSHLITKEMENPMMTGYEMQYSDSELSESKERIDKNDNKKNDNDGLQKNNYFSTVIMEKNDDLKNTTDDNISIIHNIETVHNKDSKPSETFSLSDITANSYSERDIKGEIVMDKSPDINTISIDGYSNLNNEKLSIKKYDHEKSSGLNLTNENQDESGEKKENVTDPAKVNDPLKFAKSNFIVNTQVRQNSLLASPTGLLQIAQDSRISNMTPDCTVIEMNNQNQTSVVNIIHRGNETLGSLELESENKGLLIMVKSILTSIRSRVMSISNVSQSFWFRSNHDSSVTEGGKSAMTIKNRLLRWTRNPYGVFGIFFMTTLISPYVARVIKRCVTFPWLIINMIDQLFSNVVHYQQIDTHINFPVTVTQVEHSTDPNTSIYRSSNVFFHEAR